MGIKKFIRFLSVFFGFWMVFFLVFRVVFLVYHRSAFSEFSIGQCLESIWHGLYMDISITAYFCCVPVLAWLTKDLVAHKTWVRWLNRFHLILVLVVGLLLTVDLEIFQNWGHRLDSAILPYLQFPKEALASAGSSPFRILFTIFGLSFVVSSMLWAAFDFSVLKKSEEKNGVARWWSLAAIPVLILLMRGGLQLAPMNQSSVYFSNFRTLNQAAENGIWVFLHSVLQQSDEDFKALYAPFPKEEVEKEVNQFGLPAAQSDSVLLSTTRPNVILIVWESATAKVVGHLKGPFASTPQLDNLAKNGLYFENFYANGDRSDKGLAALLSAVPSLGKLSIMFEPNLTAGLNFIPKELAEVGYQTAFLYGGDLGFANMKSFMINAGFQTLIGDADFPKSQQNSKWGAHDEAVFKRQLELAQTAKTPFFHTLFTLSSHEPFEVPGVVNRQGESLDTLFTRSHRYTDRCLGNWVAAARKTDWWKNTLLIVVADHGHSLPGQSEEASPEKYRIPMVWYGPVLKAVGSVSVFGSQTDLAQTLLTQLGIARKGFPFSRNLIGASNDQSALYAFRNGFAQIGPDGKIVLLDGQKLTPESRKPALLRQGVFQTYFQHLPPIVKP